MAEIKIGSKVKFNIDEFKIERWWDITEDQKQYIIYNQDKIFTVTMEDPKFGGHFRIDDPFLADMPFLDRQLIPVK